MKLSREGRPGWGKTRPIRVKELRTGDKGDPGLCISTSIIIAHIIAVRYGQDLPGQAANASAPTDRAREDASPKNEGARPGIMATKLPYASQFYAGDHRRRTREGLTKGWINATDRRTLVGAWFRTSIVGSKGAYRLFKGSRA